MNALYSFFTLLLEWDVHRLLNPVIVANKEKIII